MNKFWSKTVSSVLQMTELNEVSAPEFPYPYTQQALFQVDRIKSPAYAWYLSSVQYNLIQTHLASVDVITVRKVVAAR